MSVEEQYNNLSSLNGDNIRSNKEVSNPSESHSDDILMDYEQLAEAEGKPASPEPSGPHIGLNGGQSKDDNRGIDISKYAGPESKNSNEIIDPEVPYRTGPGNGLNDEPRGIETSPDNDI